MEGAYLDHAASTPARPEVVEAMLPWLADHPGNPSGSHAVARAVEIVQSISPQRCSREGVEHDARSALGENSSSHPYMPL